MIVDTVQLVTASRIGPFLRPAWRAVLQAGFLVLCVRFLVTTFQQTYPDVGTALTLITGSAVLGAWRPRAATFAFVCAVPLLNGLGYVGLNGIPSPPSIVFSALFTGITCRWVFRGANELKGRKSEAPLQKDAEEAAGRDSSASDAPILSVTDILITVILVSLAGQMVRHWGDAAFWRKLWSQPVFGYSDPSYFASSAFVWMQGLFLLRLLVGKPGLCNLVMKVEDFGALDRHARPSRVRDDKQNRDASALGTWSKPALLAWSISLLVFAIVQRQWDLPEKYAGFVHTSPFEDIHSFGAITVTSLVFFLAAFRFTLALRPIGSALCAMALLALTILSWSRATWLAGFGAIVLLTLIRVSWKWRIAIVLAGASLIFAGNQAAKTSAWQNNLYLGRLGNLIRFESPTQKDPSRMYLYHKTLGMIRERPMAGHGIGSFYLKSVNYAKPGDPYAAVPNFAHNILLQFAAELGVLAALLLGGVIGLTLVRGYRCSLSALKTPGSDLTAVGLTMALTTYLITQMTANALNIYVSNQFLFWFLVAALLGGTRSDRRSV